MNTIKKTGLSILTIICLFAFTANLLAQKTDQLGIPVNSSFVVLNEIETDNPGGDIGMCNYIELRGDANSNVPANYYLVEIEGDVVSTRGEFDTVVAIGSGGASFGTNGILTIAGTIGTCGTRSYTSDGGNLVTDSDVSGLENSSITFMVILSPTTAIVEGTDYDTNDDGTLDALPGDATIIDSVGWTDGNNVLDIVYGGVDLSSVSTTSGAPDGATRDQSNTTPNSAAAWFADDIVGGAVDSITYDQTNLRNGLLGPGFMIAFLTPGAQNLAPTAAPGTISGRARTGKGQGIKHAVIMITGGKLQQPIYATSNQFGYYKFEDLTVGQSYTMQIMSGRYTFDNPTRIVNMGDSITNEDFVTTTSIRIESGSRRSEIPKRRILKRQR